MLHAPDSRRLRSFLHADWGGRSNEKNMKGTSKYFDAFFPIAKGITRKKGIMLRWTRFGNSNVEIAWRESRTKILYPDCDALSVTGLSAWQMRPSFFSASPIRIYIKIGTSV